VVDDLAEGAVVAALRSTQDGAVDLAARWSRNLLGRRLARSSDVVLYQYNPI